MERSSSNSEDETSGSDTDDSRLEVYEKDEKSPTKMKKCRVMLELLPAAGRKRQADSTTWFTISIKKLKLSEDQLANLPNRKAQMGRPKGKKPTDLSPTSSLWPGVALPSLGIVPSVAISTIIMEKRSSAQKRSAALE